MRPTEDDPYFGNCASFDVNEDCSSALIQQSINEANSNNNFDNNNDNEEELVPEDVVIAPRSANTMRNKFLSKLAYSEVWVTP